MDEDGEAIRRISKLTLLKALRGGLLKGASNFGVSLCKLHDVEVHVIVYTQELQNGCGVIVLWCNRENQSKGTHKAS